MTTRRRKGRAGRYVLGAVAVLVAGAATAAAVGIGLPGADDSRPARSTLPPGTGTVVKQTLVDTTTETGKLGYGDTTTVNGGKLMGTLTSIAAPGSTVSRGKPLYKVDDSPVLLLYGKLPAYRDLAPGTEGTDVEQFERNLAALGHTGFTVDDSYTSSTATAVRAWQKANGLKRTGTVELGRVYYAPGKIRVDSTKAALGSSAQPGQAVLTRTGSERVVGVELDMSDAPLAKTGTRVTLGLPNGGTTGGKVSGSATVIDPGTGDGGEEGGGTGDGGDTTPSTKLKVTVALSDESAFDGLDQASVDVRFTASRRENVLTVPVAALLALSEGGYGVQVVEGGKARTVAVKTGLFAEGRVEVSGPGLAKGVTVGMPS
ncbi:peptidoglycan-binding protein [Streptomyces sp. NPDC057137]|uniref:peptidoglycan-binding protein n=1 Tax=Streptomyces sp. NPDC057137 TaxID=3346030 RepID=UPI00363C6186